MARLGGWKRIGIIVSVVWILGAGIYTYNAAMNDVTNEAWRQYIHCQAEADEAKYRRYDDAVRGGLPPGIVIDPATGEEVSAEDAYKVESRKCDEQSVAYRARRKGAPLFDAAFVVFVSLPLGWGFVYLILFLVRWVKRGFSATHF